LILKKCGQIYQKGIYLQSKDYKMNISARFIVKMLVILIIYCTFALYFCDLNLRYK